MFYYIARHLFIAALLLAVPLLDASAQKEALVWYFGYNAGLDFITPTPTVRTDGAMRTREGCAVISNSSGELLFYTNGLTVWNSRHEPMEGSDIAGDSSSTQSAIILPYPGSSIRYYIFTVDNQGQPGGLMYHIVNMSRNGGLGEIIEKNQKLITPVVEKLAIVRHSNRRDFWLIVHGWDNNEFYAFLITTTGINAAGYVRSSAGLPHVKTDSDLNALGAMKVSPDGTRIALAIYETGVFEVFNFDASTGVVSAHMPPLTLSSPDFASCYGVEFSPDSRLLYGSIRNSGAVYQFDLSLGTPDAIVNNAVVVAPGNQSLEAGSLQLGPDGRIYCARNGSGSIDVIARPDRPGLLCDYRPGAVFLKGTESSLGLPLFYNGFLKMAFTYRNICPGDSTFFSIEDTVGVTGVRWEFGDPVTGTLDTSTAVSPSHVYSDAGSYTVRLTVRRGLLEETMEREVVIYRVPPPPIPSDTVLCQGEPLVLRAERAVYTSYEWSTGETGPFITVDKPGVYWVRVSDTLCTIADTVVVRSAPDWQLTGSGDTVLCRGMDIRLLAEGGTTYRWTPDDGLDNPTSATPLARPDRTTTYTVTATGPGGCIKMRDITITVIPPPAVGLAEDTALCPDDVIALDAGEQPPGTTYLWSTGETTRTIAVSSPGNYRVVVRNGNCETADTIRVYQVDRPAVATIADTSICRGGSVELRATGAVVYQWFSDAGPLDPALPNPVVSPLQTTTYTVLATGPGGCTSTASVTVTVVGTPVITVVMPVVSAVVGTRDIRIPISLSATETVVLPALTFTVEFDALSFRATGVTGSASMVPEQVTGANGRVSITLPNVEVTTAPQVYTALTGDALAGSSPSTPLSVRIQGTAQCVASQPQDGLLSLQGCAVGGRAVVFAGSTALAISPNPAAEYAEVQLSSASDDMCTLAVYSMHGQRVWHRQFAAGAGSITTAMLETALLAPGLYNVVLTAGPDTAVATLVVQR